MPELIVQLWFSSSNVGVGSVFKLYCRTDLILIQARDESVFYAIMFGLLGIGSMLAQFLQGFMFGISGSGDFKLLYPKYFCFYLIRQLGRDMEGCGFTVCPRSTVEYYNTLNMYIQMDKTSMTHETYDLSFQNYALIYHVRSETGQIRYI